MQHRLLCPDAKNSFLGLKVAQSLLFVMFLLPSKDQEERRLSGSLFVFENPLLHRILKPREKRGDHEVQALSSGSDFSSKPAPGTILSRATIAIKLSLWS